MTTQIPYGDSSVELVFDYPSGPTGWTAQDITAVSLMVTDYAGSDLLDAAASCTLWDGVIETGTTPAATDTYIDVTDDDNVDPRPGRRYRIVSADTGTTEDVVCDRWADKDTNDFRIHLEEDLVLAHAAADDVYGCYAVATVDFSDTDVFTKGRKLRLVWTPTGGDNVPVVQVAVVGTTQFDAPDISDTGQTNVPTDDQILQWFKDDLNTEGIVVDRIQGDVTFQQGLFWFAKVQKIAAGYGDSSTHELAEARKEFDRVWAKILQNKAHWQDLDQDGAQDTDTEVYTPGWSYGERSY